VNVHPFISEEKKLLRLLYGLNMELDLQSLFGLLCTVVYSLAETPQLFPSPPPHLGSYTRALVVSQDRRHIFVTPWAARTDACARIFKQSMGAWIRIGIELSHPPASLKSPDEWVP
jgi:hypothetical protein